MIFRKSYTAGYDKHWAISKGMRPAGSPTKGNYHANKNNKLMLRASTIREEDPTRESIENYESQKVHTEPAACGSPTASPSKHQ